MLPRDLVATWQQGESGWSAALGDYQALAEVSAVLLAANVQVCSVTTWLLDSLDTAATTLEHEASAGRLLAQRDDAAARQAAIAAKSMVREALRRAADQVTTELAAGSEPVALVDWELVFAERVPFTAWTAVQRPVLALLPGARQAGTIELFAGSEAPIRGVPPELAPSGRCWPVEASGQSRP